MTISSCLSLPISTVLRVLLRSPVTVHFGYAPVQCYEYSTGASECSRLRDKFATLRRKRVLLM